MCSLTASINSRAGSVQGSLALLNPAFTPPFYLSILFTWLLLKRTCTLYLICGQNVRGNICIRRPFCCLTVIGVFESMIFYKAHDYLHHQCSVICSYYSTLTFLPFKLCSSCYQWSISVFHIFIGNEQPQISTPLPLSQVQKAFGIILRGLHYSNPLVLWFLL